MRNLGMKKLQGLCVVAAALICALGSASASRGQAVKPRLVTQAVDESNRVTMRGNVHPLARAEFDQGAIADRQPVDRIYLLLNRSAEQQAALANVVMGIPSLHNFRKESHVRRFGKFRRDLLTGETRPLFTFTDVNGTFFGMGPADFAKIYNIPAGADGTGQSIAIVGRSNINIQDVRDFRTMLDLPANDPVIILKG